MIFNYFFPRKKLVKFIENHKLFQKSILNTQFTILFQLDFKTNNLYEAK